MNQEIFKLHLSFAVAAMRRKTGSMVTNSMPASNRFYVTRNPFLEDNTLHQRESFDSDLKTSQVDQRTSYSDTEIVDLLWRDGYIPLWIDITPYEEDGEHTYFELRCSGSITNDDAKLFYHQKEGHQPFHLFGPIVPPGWRSDSPKFDLHHHRDRMRARSSINDE